MPKQRIIILIIGIILALIAVFMVKFYLDQQRRMIQEQAKQTLSQIQANQTPVLVAKKDISKGTVIDAEMLETAIVPNQFVQPQAVASLDRISGMSTIAPISKGEQISLTKLSYPRQVEGGGLAEATPIGKRAITISVDNISSLAGMIKPGDYVDVIAIIPVPVQTPEGKQATQPAVVPLFQNVLVLAIGQEIGVAKQEQQEEGRYRREEAREPSPLITLALSPQEANLIAFVQEQAKIRLVLRSPADSKIEPIQPASWDTLFQYIMPKEALRQQEEARKEQEPQVVPQAGSYVEIYRGLKREVVPLKE